MHHAINTPNQKGVSLVIGVVIMSLILTTALAISSIFFGEIRNSRIFEKSTQSFYAADSGAEAILFNQRKNYERFLAEGTYSCKNNNLGIISFENSELGCEIVITGSGSIFLVTGQYNITEAQRRVEVKY